MSPHNQEHHEKSKHNDNNASMAEIRPESPVDIIMADPASVPLVSPKPFPSPSDTFPFDRDGLEAPPLPPLKG